MSISYLAYSKSFLTASIVLSILVVALLVYLIYIISSSRKSTNSILIFNSENQENEDSEINEYEKQGDVVVIKKYRLNFEVRLGQLDEEIKNYYSDIKNKILSVKKSNYKVLKTSENFNVGKFTVAKFVIIGNTLTLFIALDKNSIDDSNGIDFATEEKYKKVPCKIQIKNNKTCNMAMELLDRLFEINDFQYKQSYEPQNFAEKALFMTKEEAIEKNLGMIIISEMKIDEFNRFKATQDIRNKKILSISSSEANNEISDDTVKLLRNTIKGDVVQTNKVSISLDIIRKAYVEGEIVNIHTLKQKGLIPQDTLYLSIVAGKVLDKKLEVEANNISNIAEKMILLMGGKVTLISGD